MTRNGLLIALAAILLASAASAADQALAARVERVLAGTPLVDGHNDLPWEIRDRFHGSLDAVDLRADQSHAPGPNGAVALMTDIPRLRAGHVGAQFWSVWVPVDLKGPDAVQLTFEQIDLVKRIAARYPTAFEMAYTSASGVA